MKVEEDKPPKSTLAREWWLTLLAIFGIGGATVAGLWLVSYFCLSQPSSALNLSDWECGGWATVLGIGILIAGAVLLSVSWRVINRKN